MAPEKSGEKTNVLISERESLEWIIWFSNSSFILRTDFS